MTRGIGVDIVEIDRITRLLERHPARARRRLFTPAEARTCDARPDASACFAARFAAKEAFLKAIGRGLRDGIEWRDLEVRADQAGQPELRVSGAAERQLQTLGAGRIHLSLAHDSGTAIAFVVIEG